MLRFLEQNLCNGPSLKRVPANSKRLLQLFDFIKRNFIPMEKEEIKNNKKRKEKKTQIVDLFILKKMEGRAGTHAHTFTLAFTS